MDIRIRLAVGRDAAVIEEMLLEAAQWVDALGVVMWEEGELDSARIEREVAAGEFFIADVGPAEAGLDVRRVRLQPDGVHGGHQRDRVPAGAIRFQLSDQQFWPDLPHGDSAFVHRLVVRRAFKGQGVSTALLEWSVARARSLGKRFLRLDCDAQRTRLRELYERFGFGVHSYRQVGSYYVARYELPL